MIAYIVIARIVSDEAIHTSFPGLYGLQRGACHRARIRATRWLAMTCRLHALLNKMFQRLARRQGAARNRAYRLPDFGPCRSSGFVVLYSLTPIRSFRFLAPGLKPLTPPSAAAARLDRVVLPLPPKKSVLPAAPARADRPFRGIALILASTVFLGTSDVTSNYLSATLPSIEIAWIRFLVFALVMVPAMLPGSPLFALHTSRPGLQAMRGAALLGSSLLFISGLRFLPIAEASATSFVSPLFVTALSILFLRESVGLRRWAATAVGLIGVLIILRPGSSAFHPAAVFPLVSAFCWALTLVMTRMLSGRERVITTMTYSAISGFLILSALVPLVWVAPSWHDILFGILIGVT